jgi:hypothetical protein
VGQLWRSGSFGEGLGCPSSQNASWSIGNCFRLTSKLLLFIYFLFFITNFKIVVEEQ